MKTILISIKPEHCQSILDGKKTLEIRKSAPKLEDMPYRVLIYCTKAKPTLYTSREAEDLESVIGNGKIIAEFTLKRFDVLRYVNVGDQEFYVNTSQNGDDNWKENVCVPYEKIVEYGKKARLNLWHIENLIKYEKPVGLANFGQEDYIYNKELGKWQQCFESFSTPPQSWCYVIEKKNVRKVENDV